MMDEGYIERLQQALPEDRTDEREVTATLGKEALKFKWCGAEFDVRPSLHFWRAPEGMDPYLGPVTHIYCEYEDYLVGYYIKDELLEDADRMQEIFGGIKAAIEKVE